MRRSVAFALGAAVLFGASTPLAKLLVGELAPLLLAGLLYLGSGVGLCAVRVLRDRGWRAPGLEPGEWPWFCAAILFGGVLAPVAFVSGLRSTDGSAAALLLNLEAVLTAVIAWVIFRENAGTRVVAGMIAIVAGGAVLAWPTEGSRSAAGWGALLIAAACLCWAIDNNLTRRVAGADALFIAGLKGLAAGTINTSLALALGAKTTEPAIVAATMSVGLVGYGLSLVLFVLALRGLGSARTGAYFATAPFIGAALALLLLDEPRSTAFWMAGGLMALGVWLHLSERHAHVHTHETLEHRHPHVHDAHHQHTHRASEDTPEPHDHVHRHESVTHTHPHYPDLHHRHSH
jgi:drug/metabolite transporter (DMT)-like permease